MGLFNPHYRTEMIQLVSMEMIQILGFLMPNGADRPISRLSIFEGDLRIP